ncbi:acid protease [Athelia psychrophila]|uniref:Acid protease n=1 Tax=Athelia psychrophila TaxID=1759441 RepID=A0A166QUQ6_9AGAM|nr:acid protease [Fibularhizoctonia sp. CBS 109695]
MILTIFALLCGISTLVYGAHLPIVGRSTRSLSPRSSILGDTGPLNNLNNMIYYTNITLGGSLYQVVIDTGSSDLWVSGDPVPNAKDTGVRVGVQYAIGQAEGPILLAELGFEGYKVENQSFIFATANETNSLPATGIIGLGPFSTSNIVGALTTKTTTTTILGLPPLDNIFRQNTTTPNFLTVLLGRAEDPDNNYPGDLTIMEVLPGYEGILDQPKLPVTAAQHGGQHWSALLDADGLVGPDGEPIAVKTRVGATKNKKQLTVMFDTGFTYPQVTASMAEAIYGRFTGSKLENITDLGEVWTLPCDAEVNITLKFGGQSIPIHPLDATFHLPSPRTDCYGTFQPITTGASLDFDVIMGMAFLRNAYFLVNFGSDFSDVLEGFNAVLNGTHNKQPPYIQLLPTSSDAAEVHDDFQQVRIQGKTFSELSSLKEKAKSAGKTIARGVIIAAAVAGAVVLCLLALLCFCCFRRRTSRSSSYRGLNDPAPAAAVDMHGVSQARPMSAPYTTAWDTHR